MNTFLSDCKDNRIVVNAIHKTYNVDGASVNALKGVSFVLPDRGMIFVIGKSGCGKSTLLNILGGLDKPTEGWLSINGKRVDFSNEKYLDLHRNQDIGFIFQDHNLLDGFSIKDNLKLSLSVQGQEATDAQIDQALAEVDLEDCKDKLPNQISGGQRQRASIARALIKKPRIILADEPTGNLDSVNGKKVFDLFKELSAEHLVLIATHDLDSAYTYGDRIIELKDGEIVDDLVRSGDFDIKPLKERYDKEIAQAFVSNTNEIATTMDAPAPIERDCTSQLSAKNAVSILFKWLRQSKLSILISILILGIALGTFGIVHTVTRYDYAMSLSKSLRDRDVASALLIKGKLDIEHFNLNITGETFTYDEYLSFSQNYPVYKIILFPFNFEKYVNKINVLYQPHIRGVCEIGNDFDATMQDFYHASLLTGRAPEPNKDYIEIVISDYLADSILFYGTNLQDKTIYPNEPYDKLLYETFSYKTVPFKIVGIYRSQYSHLYQDYVGDLTSEDYSGGYTDDDLRFAMQTVYPLALTVGNAIEYYVSNSVLSIASLSLRSEEKNDYYRYDCILIAADKKGQVGNLVKEYETDIVWAADYTDTTIADDQLLISFDKYLELFDKYEFDESYTQINQFEYLTPNDINDLYVYEKIDEERSKAYKVVGVFGNPSIEQTVFVVNKKMREEHLEDTLDSYALLLRLKDTLSADMVASMHADGIIVYSAITERLLYFDWLFYIAKEVMLMVIFTLLFFVTILMYSVVNKDIKRKQKDIGILRSLGANRGDLTKVFMLYDLFYVICSLIIAVLFYVGGGYLTNYLLCVKWTTGMSLLILNPWSALLMIGLSVIVMAISSILPIIKYTKMSPMDVIRNTDGE